MSRPPAIVRYWPDYVDPDGLNPSGLCQCECGGSTPLATWNSPAKGLIRGQPVRFMHGHKPRWRRFAYTEKDCGYETPCYIWSGLIDRNGYGRFGDKNELAHRLSYGRSIGPIPDGKSIHHLCEIRACVRPDHLEAVTRAEHRSRHGTITPTLADAVRKASGSQREISLRFGISQGSVWQIMHGYNGPLG